VQGLEQLYTHTYYFYSGRLAAIFIAVYFYANLPFVVQMVV